MTKRFFKEHYLIAVSGLLLTLLIEAPLLAFPFVSKNYQDINIPHFGTDSHFYLSRAQEALERNNLGNAFLREGKDNQDAYFVYNERALALLPRVFGLADAVSAPTFYAIYNFAGVFALILLIYFFTLQLAPGKLLAAVAAIFVVGGYHIAYKDFFYMDFNLYGRPIFPYLSSLALFLYLFFLVKSVNTDRVAYKISAGVLFGALFYVIFYGWTFVLALNGALFLFYLFKKDFARLKMIAQISAIGVSLGLYNFVKMLRFAASDIGSQSSYFNSRLNIGVLDCFKSADYHRQSGAARALPLVVYRPARNNFGPLYVMGFAGKIRVAKIFIWIYSFCRFCPQRFGAIPFFLDNLAGERI